MSKSRTKNKLTQLTTLLILVAVVLGGVVTPAAAQVAVVKKGGNAGKFASFVQETKELQVGAKADLLSGKVKAQKYNRNLNRVTLYVSPGKNNQVKEPWVAFDDLHVEVNGYDVRSVDVDDASLWKKVSNSSGKDIYAVTVYEGNIVLPARLSPSFGVTVDVSEGARQDTWSVWMPENGIVTWVKETGNVIFGPSRIFTYKVINDVEIKEGVQLSSLNTDVNVEGENGNLGDFEIEFEATAIDGDVYIAKTTGQSGQEGVIYGVEGNKDAKVSSAITSMAEEVAGYYVVREGESEEFSLNVWVEAVTSGNYKVVLKGLNYRSGVAMPPIKFQVVSNPKDYSTPSVVLQGKSVVATSTAKINSFVATPTTVASGQPVTLTWSASGVSSCTLIDGTGEKPVTMKTGLNANGTYQVMPLWKDNGKDYVQYLLNCQDASTLKDKVVGASVTVKLQGTITPPEKVVFPNKNAFNCNRTVATKLGANGLACYGMWDYGEGFGGDVAMCGGYNEGKTGCVIKTPVCQSGSAKATKYFTGKDISTEKMIEVNALLKTNSATVKEGVAGLWEYRCTAPAVAKPIVTNTNASSTVGSVRGISTDDITTQLAAIAAALEDILAAMKK